MLKIFTAALVLFVATAHAQDTTERLKIAAEMSYAAKNELLDKWYPQSVDTIYGGFLSTFTYDFMPEGTQDKMIVTQARHVWSNAKASEFYPNIPFYKPSAQHGFYFLRDVMWDKQYGGFYNLVARDGRVKSTIKEAYGNSFGIFALAAYYHCSGDTGVLNLVKKAFLWMEKNSHDPVYKGYYQHLNRDGKSG